MTTLPGSKPVEETEAFRIASLHSRLAACDQLLETAARLEELKVELESAYAELRRHEHQINQEHEKQLAEARDHVATAEAGCAKAKESHAVASRQLIAARDRDDSLAKEDFTSENQHLIDEQIRTRSTSVRDELAQAHKQLDEHNRANTAITAKLSALQRDLDNATADLKIFTDSEVPDNYARLHQDAIEEARNSIDAELRSLETALAAASKEAEQVRASISHLAKKIEAFQSRQNELKRLSSQPLWRKLESSAWWGSFGPDYGKRIAALCDQLEKSKQQLASIEISQQKKRGEQANLAAGRGKRLDEVAIGSAAQLRAACQAKIDALHNEIASAKGRLQAASHGIASTSSDILNLEGELDRITTEARQSAIAALKKEAAHEVEAATTRLRETQQLVHDNQDAYAKLVESLTSLELGFAASKADRLRGDGERTAAVKMLFDRTAEELSLSMAKHGINFTNDEFRSAIDTARRQAEVEIERQTPDQNNDFFRDHANEGRRPMDVGADDSVDVAGDQRAAGNLYFDFAKNEDDNQDKRGRTYPGLRTQLEDLRKRHKNAFFAKIDDGDDVFATLVDAMFPEGATKSYVVCNLSLHDQPYLSIRPQIIGPRLERLIPRGMSLAICGRLWDNQRDLDNPVFLAQRVVDISHSPARPFERVITGFVFTEAPNVYPASQRQQNILDTEFIRRLPAISVETRSRLADWHAYLAWKERLIHARLVGLRYLGVDVTSDGRVQFLTASPSQQDFERIRRTLRNDELYAYGLRYSQDPWEFEYNDQHRERGAELGDFIGQDTIPQAPDTDTDGLPWDDPFFAQVSFRLPEDAQREFEGIIDAGGSVEEAARQYLQTVHPQGFLALSVVGDMALIRRQRSELQLLQEQSGFAPFLSSYLFDISAASEPSQLIEISDDNWSQPRLNDDQRLAVRKMVSTPDLAMVQGPPGTGKTTMIAEAIWQYARQGKKVLLVSQASLAVNNALERLPQIPAIRAVRMSRRERKNERDHPYSRAIAVSTFYRSIADACSKRTLELWSSAESRRVKIAKWMADAELIKGDLNSLRSKLDEISTEARESRKELEKLKEKKEQASTSEQYRINLQSMQRFINGSNSFSGSFPEAILDQVYNLLILPWESLRQADIQINALWSNQQYGSADDRSRFFREALLNWRSALSLRSQLAGDIERLANSEGDTVMSPELAAELAHLKRKLDETQQAMVEDASKVAEWQAIQRQMQDLRRSGTGLNRDVYSGLFNIPDSACLTTIADERSKKHEVLGVLKKALDAIDSVAPQVNKVLAEIGAELQDAESAIQSPDIDEAALHHLQGEIRQQEERIRETAGLVRNKEERMARILKECPILEDSSAAGSVDYTAVIETSRSELEQLDMEIARSQTFRDAWTGILKDWVDDLQNVATIRCDQDNFLDTYVSACNVVGVTCTENRRTLEDAGHTWFDSVIVDEVSKATPTEIVMPLMMARTAILVGDHRQLPPLFKEHEGSWEEAVADQEEADDDERDTSSELTAENFERFKKMVTSSLFKEHFENAPDSLKSFLFTQYRMHPQIMHVVNQFYENRLNCGLEDPDGKNPESDSHGHRLHGLTLIGEKSQEYITPDRHVAWLDSTLDPHQRTHHERRDLGSSKVNELECILIAKSLCDIEMSCRDQGYGLNGRPRKEVGVITFYGRQVRSIREAIQRAQSLYNIRFTSVEYDINTVDRYQGQERPIIIVSMVRNPPFKLSQRANTAQFERINVAFSRAQELLIISGAKDVFSKYPVLLPHLDKPGHRKVDVYRYIIDEIQRDGGLWPSEFIVSTSDYDQLLPRDFQPQRKPTRHPGGTRRSNDGKTRR